jgi:hypothetical protein
MLCLLLLVVMVVQVESVKDTINQALQVLLVEQERLVDVEQVLNMDNPVEILESQVHQVLYLDQGQQQPQHHQHRHL